MSLSAAKRTQRASLMEETSNPVGRAKIQKATIRWPFVFLLAFTELSSRVE